MSPRLRQLLTCCVLWLSGAIALAGPGAHLIAPCDHGEHESSSHERLDQLDRCPICSFHAQGQTPAPDASLVSPAPPVARTEALPPRPARRLPGRPSLPRSPPIG